MLSILVVTVCLNSAMTEGCEVKRQEYVRENTCQWNKVAETNKFYKQGKENYSVKGCADTSNDVLAYNGEGK